MSHTLIIAEKPSAAQKIAYALADSKPKIEKKGKVSYYKLTHKNKEIVIVSAAGHLYTLAERKKTNDYPSFDIKWYPIYEIRKDAKHTKQFLDVIKELAKNADEFIIACDYDTEGEVIGYNILRFACNQNNAKRMKFSTLTKQELINSFENASKTIDWGQAYAGLTRHQLDWLYGINLSRALTNSIKNTGSFKIMSIGRVQGPSLNIIAKKEKEIQEFIPQKYWEITVKGIANNYDLEAIHEKDKIFNKEIAEEIYNKVNKNNGIISKVSRTKKTIFPPVPFDLTQLQTESYRVFRLNPKRTLEIAQKLYLGSYISYPRTSSQKLPPSIGYINIIKQLSKNQNYNEICKQLIEKNNEKKIFPRQGKKEDPAHPAIYPTGVIPKKLNEEEQKLYDLIVKRFLAAFGEPAIRETTTININIKEEIFKTTAYSTKYKGWIKIYNPYASFKESEEKEIEENTEFINKKTTITEKETEPPKRYTQSSLITELEKRNLGTKATRAQIIDTLYQRGYVEGDPIKITELGMKTNELLEKNIPKIVDEELTRHFEEEMEKIRTNYDQKEKVIEESKEVLRDILSNFKEKESKIGTELKDAILETNKQKSFFGPCPKCKDGNLALKRGKFGNFLACDRYPDCDFTLSIPQSISYIKYTGKNCEFCGYPLVKISYKNKNNSKKSKLQVICINTNCPAKKKEQKEEDNLKEIIEKLKCPECGSKLTLRKGLHGYFIGCSNYPKCRYTEDLKKIINNTTDQ